MAIHATLQAKAHEWIGQINPYKLAGFVHLLEVMVNESVEPVTEEDRRRFQEGQAIFAGGKGIPMADVLAGFSWKLEAFPLNE